MPRIAWWPGMIAPPHTWQDNDGNPIVFGGADNSEYLLGKGPSKRDSFFFYADQAFGGLRVENDKFLFTAKDT
ncbi:MAG TPA: hypothetical protein VFU81_21050 [Thermomicrobiales bacterium]|nr:hypothetical protein [Thermomicrobiales bacterium]